MVGFASRSTEPEILDRETPSRDVLEKCFRFIRGVNRYLGGRRALISRFREFAKSWAGPIRVLDVGSGVADLPAALQSWGRREGHDLTVVAVDIDRSVLRIARDWEPDVPLCRCDVNRLGFKPGSFDYVISSMFFHHLSDEQVVGAFRTFDRIATRGIVINDLLRRVRAWLWIKAMTLPFHPILRNDGPLSVRKAFTVREIEDLARRAGVTYLAPRVHFGHRFTLAGER